jgi:ubiquinone/menaquinone biosynthesis C-methylase UbiE
LTNFATSGADASEEMLKIAQKKHSEKEFFQAKSNELPFERKLSRLSYISLYNAS